MIYESTDHTYKKNTDLNEPSHPCTNIRTKWNKVKGTVSSYGEDFAFLYICRTLSGSQHIL